jgi:hypothetical protein
MDVWADAYLAAFLIGLLSVGGMLLVSGMHHGHGHRHVGGAGQGHHAHGHAHGHAYGGDAGDLSQTVWTALSPFFNFSSLLALLMAGGGSGYVTLKMGLGRLASVATAVGGGVGGAYLMVGVMRLLWRAEAGVVRPTDPSGTIARVIAPISAARMGEIVFSRADGARQALPAKLDREGSDIERDAEVVVMRVERGTAYVTRLAALAAKESK